MRITNPAPAPFATCDIATDSGTITVPCEPVGNGIVITPVFGMDDDGNSLLGGDFILTHEATGTMLSDGGGCIECCRSAGKAILETGIDFSQIDRTNSAEVAAAWSDGVRQAFSEARMVNWSCDADLCDPWPEGAIEKVVAARKAHLTEPCGACGLTGGRHADHCIHVVVPMVARENARVERSRNADTNDAA